jgi:hypothetical protein
MYQTVMEYCSWGSTLNKVACYIKDGQILFPSFGRDFRLHHDVEIGCVADPLSYTVDTGCSIIEKWALTSV